MQNAFFVIMKYNREIITVVETKLPKEWAQELLRENQVNM